LNGASEYYRTILRSGKPAGSIRAVVLSGPAVKFKLEEETTGYYGRK
jgi:hypothetical protein